MADRALAEMGADPGASLELPAIRLPRDWRPNAICLSQRGLLIGAGADLWLRQPTGQFEKLGTLPGELTALADAGDGTLWVSTRAAVYRMDAGRPTFAFQPKDSARSNIVSLAASTERVWVADAGNRRIWILDGSGRLVASFGERTSDYPGLVVPSPHLDVVRLPDGRFANVNPGLHRIELRNSDGRLLGFFGESGSALEQFPGCCNPTDLAALPDSAIATMEKGLPRIKVYDTDGRLLSLVAGSASFHPSTPGGDMAASANGEIWFLDRHRGEVRRFVREVRKR